MSLFLPDYHIRKLLILFFVGQTNHFPLLVTHSFSLTNSWINAHFFAFEYLPQLEIKICLMLRGLWGLVAVQWLQLSAQSTDSFKTRDPGFASQQMDSLLIHLATSSNLFHLTTSSNLFSPFFEANCTPFLPSWGKVFPKTFVNSLLHIFLSICFFEVYTYCDFRLVFLVLVLLLSKQWLYIYSLPVHSLSAAVLSVGFDWLAVSWLIVW